MVRSNPVGTAVGSVVLSALLLTGCGTDDDVAATPPSSAASSAATTAAEPGPDATPADYVPASLVGPAQNVPEPVMPDLAREESREGAQAFLDYWSDAMWYAYQTGDTSFAWEVTNRSCAVCNEELKTVKEAYELGAWLVGGRETLEIQEDSFYRASDGVYKPVVKGWSEGGKLVEGGKVTYEEPSEIDPTQPFLVYLDYQDHSWIYITAAEISGG
jgi:hypothetical protein